MGSRRWIAASGGVLINGLVLAALVLVENPPPPVEDPPPMLVELERPQRQRTPARRAAAAAGLAVARPASASASEAAPAETGPSASPPAEPAPPAIDPAWRMDQKTIDRWRLIEGAPGANWGRYHRACMGLSDEHLTPDEKERCIGGWKDRPATKRPSPGFIGPIDERHWEVPEPKSDRYDKEETRKQACRDYRRGRTPGFAERNMPTGAPPPSLREGGCF